jgi:hypothetical protein
MRTSVFIKEKKNIYIYPKKKNFFFSELFIFEFVFLFVYLKDDGLENIVYVCLLYLIAVSYLRKQKLT